MSDLREGGWSVETANGPRVTVMASTDTDDVAVGCYWPGSSGTEEVDRTMVLSAGQAARLAMSLAKATEDAFDTTGPGKPPQGHSGLRERVISEPCVVCGKAILPGQCYVVSGPHHVVCSPPKRLDVARVIEATKRR